MRTRRFHKRSRALLTVLLGLALTTTGWLSVAPAAAQDEAGESVLVTLAELDGSGVSGTATLTASGAQTGVTVQVAGASGVHPAHIHPGTCEAHDPTPAFPLTSVDASGASNSTIGAALADLLTGGYVVDLHLSALELGTYVTCGPIPAGAGVEAATTTETEPELVEAAEPVADVAAASTDTSDTTTETDQTAAPAAANVVTAPETDTTASATTSGATNPETSIAAGHTSALARSGSATTTTATNATSASAAASGTTTSTTAVTASGIGTTFRAAGAGSAAVALVAALLAATLAAGAMMARGREARR